MSKLEFLKGTPHDELLEIIEELPDGYKVRKWEFDEKWDAFPTQNIFIVPKENVQCAPKDT